MRGIVLLAVAIAWLPIPAGVAAVELPSTFEVWLADLLAEARERGFPDPLLDDTLRGVHPLLSVLESDRSQAEATLSFDDYVRRRVTPDAVQRGRARARAHADLLARVRERFGVPPGVIVAIWGLESQFGDRTGDVSVFRALATLAWEGRRGTLFRSQLYDALTIVDRGDVDAASMIGSWAGAMGQPQFMPSSYLAYAVDFDGDGRRDIWSSHADTFASIANYLRSNGWRGAEWGREVRIPPAVAASVGDPARERGCAAMRSMTPARTLAAWKRLGLRRADGGALPDTATPARLVRAGRRAFLVHESYEALLRYNCAHHYALSVALLADRIR
jgi:membrane-bound lytic murein transglycosylase B